MKTLLLMVLETDTASWIVKFESLFGVAAGPENGAAREIKSNNSVLDVYMILKNVIHDCLLDSVEGRHQIQKRKYALKNLS